MHKVSELVGKSIVSAATGELIGKVSDVLLDRQSQQVVGLVVAGGLVTSEHVLPFADVQTLGTDAVIARSASGMVSAKEWHEREVDVMRASALKRKRVLTTSGRALGEVGDVVLDDVGNLEGFEVTGSALGGLLHPRSRLPHSRGVTIGTDALLVEDDAVPTEAP
jgi:uncharacterized protein YrrD